jgi:hypothetical protein
MRMTVVLLTALLASQVAANAQSAPAATPTDSPAKAQPAETLPVASVSFDGPALTFDFAAVQIGMAEYEDGPTGATTATGLNVD